MTVSDEILISRCCEGDDRAWEALLRRYGPLVRAVPRRFNLPPDVCDDICQNVFQSLVENLASLRSTASVSAWLSTVARRHSLRHLERLPSPLHNPDQHEEPPNIALQEWEERRELMQALEQIPEPCRDLIRALFLDPTCPGYAEVARRLGRPIGSLGPMRRRCLTRLARILTPSPGEPAPCADEA